MIPRLLVFDSGIGGLSVLREIRRLLPGAAIIYVADDAGFPYGARPEAALTERVVAIVGELIGRYRPDAVVIACNTASTLVLPPLRASHALPFIGTVPAVKPAAQQTGSGLISVLATPGTIARDYTRALIEEFAGAAEVTLVGAPLLATLAEARMRGEAVEEAVVAAEIAPAFVERNGRRTDTIVLACTHYPFLADIMERVAPWPVTWIDPAPAIARRVVAVLGKGGGEAGMGEGTALLTSGSAWPDAMEPLLRELGLAPGRSTPVHPEAVIGQAGAARAAG
jgi:glutamate racemase